MILAESFTAGEAFIPQGERQPPPESYLKPKGAVQMNIKTVFMALGLMLVASPIFAQGTGQACVREAIWIT